MKPRIYRRTYYISPRAPWVMATEASTFFSIRTCLSLFQLSKAWPWSKQAHSVRALGLSGISLVQRCVITHSVALLLMPHTNGVSFQSCRTRNWAGLNVRHQAPGFQLWIFRSLRLMPLKRPNAVPYIRCSVKRLTFRLQGAVGDGDRFSKHAREEEQGAVLSHVRPFACHGLAVSSFACCYPLFSFLFEKMVCPLPPRPSGL